MKTNRKQIGWQRANAGMYNLLALLQKLGWQDKVVLITGSTSRMRFSSRHGYRNLDYED